MANYKEIVTKAILGKGKKTFTTTDAITPEIVPTTILGCWVINHNFKGYKNGDKINIEGSYDDSCITMVSPRSQAPYSHG